MNVLRKLSTAIVGFVLISCTAETREGEPTGPDSPGAGSGAPRQEVLVTFRNQLSVGSTTKSAGSDEGAVTKAAEAPIATAVENKISALDIYVFGSEAEDGVYTYQERFAYRENRSDLPAGATELELESPDDGASDKTTALLSLKKGLFVKLYCIANQPDLVDPADETRLVSAADFKPLELAEPGKPGSAVSRAGVPEVTAFETFHTPLIDPAAAQDTLVCPLPMSGYAGEVLDLTDYTAASRVKVSFKLTRMVARFDISNNSELSRFRIESVSMVNGRKGAGFFPIRVYGALPDAAPGDLITYPERKFHGEKANLGIQTSAFYCYPSVLSDEGQLVLNGTYRVNKTDSIPVSYPIRFTPKGNETGTYLEVNHNHRYTIAITGADAEHLDFVVQVSDWSDSGELDDYDPQNKPGEMEVTVPDAFSADTQWDRDERTVTMSLKTGSHFDVSMGSNSALIISKSYAGKNPEYDWLEVSEPRLTPNTKALTAFGYTYTLSLKEGYTLGRYPKATVRFTDSASGLENVLFVDPILDLQASEVPKTPDDTNPNEFDAQMLTASVFRIADSEVKIKVLCPDGAEVEDAPSWLTITSEQTGVETVFTVTLNNQEIGDTEGTIVFRNKKNNSLKMDVTVQLLNADITPSFSALGGNGNQYTPPVALTDTGNIVVPVVRDNSFSVQARSMKGVTTAIDYHGGSEWLVEKRADQPEVTARRAFAGMSSGKVAVSEQDTTIAFTIDSTKLVGARKATVTLKNGVVGGDDCIFTVTPKFQGVTVAKEGVSVPANDTLANTAFTLYKLPETTSTMSIRLVSFGGSKLSYTGTGVTLSATENTAAEAVYTLTATGAGTGTLKVMNYADTTQFTNYAVTVKESALAVQNTNIDLDAAADKTATNKLTACPLGYTAFITWVEDAEEWFEITSTNPSTTTGEQNITLKVKSGLSNDAVIDTACITLTNTIAGGGNVSFRVTPVWQAPTLGSTSGSVGIGKTVSVPAKAYGGIKATSSDTSIATVAVFTGTGDDSGKDSIRISGVAVGTATITVENTQNADKKTTYSVTVNAGNETVTIGGLKWAVGNLVADGEHGCKVGAPTDGGLYFRWGSLVGYDNSVPTGNPTAVVTPMEYTGGKPLFTASPYADSGNITENVAGGKGDPCKYYLGGTWRLPTDAEYRDKLGGGVTGTTTFKNWAWTASYENSGVAGAVLNNTAEGPKIFFPASGLRNHSSGTLSSSGSNGYVWSSVPSSSYAYGLCFNSGHAYVNDSYRNNGFTVRCVQE